eukprot:g34179.t1
MNPATTTPALPPGIYVTLPNWGNTCFVNSVVQYLIPLYEWLHRHHPNGAWAATPIALLHRTMNEARDNNDPNQNIGRALAGPPGGRLPIRYYSVDTDAGDRALDESKPGCAQEFLTYALNQLLKTLQPSPTGTQPGSIIVPPPSDYDPGHPRTSLVFRTRTETNCHQCYYHSSRMSEPEFPTLRCKLPAVHQGNGATLAPVRIETGIRQMLHISTLPEYNSIRCDCPKKD